MSDNVPKDLFYTESHEWVRDEEDGTVSVGISDHAQAELTELVFVELPEIGKIVQQGDACAVVESVKTASDIYAPLAGEVIEINDELPDNPERVNEDAFGEGWFFRLKLAEGENFEHLLSPEKYNAQISG
ncbi:glycine cleavage system protein GcvH [Verrucomicrobia bacterium]|nr:glycine cleavage system protein GcvH [Verrucomicrobiota bacterium]